MYIYILNLAKISVCYQHSITAIMLLAPLFISNRISFVSRVPVDELKLERIKAMSKR